MRIDLNGKVVLITGASSGFGADAARLFAREGCRVVLAARRRERLEAVAGEIREQGGQALVVPTDVTVLAEVQAMVEQALAAYGRIDILFNNAGFGRLDWLEKLDPLADIQSQLMVDLLGAVQVARAVLPSMLAQRSGHIINMASMAGWIAPPLYSIYSAGKFGLRGFTDALRREVAPLGVHVSGVYPGGAATEFGQHIGTNPAKRRFKTPAFLKMSSEYIAQRVVGLARRPRRSLVLPWWFVLVIGLENNFRGLVDWILISFFSRRHHHVP